ncbi:Stringent starvation protein B [Methyloligella halotolerans]|uniref:Stringent starvation protein B n=1 Tax=Methyloligella halotolerans TaxID=1177755 RepID=A0A1E2S3S5_9HYPH|nr:ClpXP protease specificity-enhancing factor SspB [Methyloligella halotolerans]ODA68989.1 Stringent starvation protein B [Methyloligella halotolerans]
MAQDEIRYDLLIQDALRSVIRKVLVMVRDDGLPGEHHLYIAFDTTADGVQISDRLKEQYPEEMTVVLQYQFWDLVVGEDRFEVKLSFSNVPERLVVPFEAVKAFYDPSVQFGLQFTQPGAANDAARQHLAAAMPDLVSDADDGEPGHGSHDAAVAESDSDDDHPPAKSGEVVELDRFRKK